MFGSIEGGCSLGQICCEDFKNTKKRFYGAVTVQDSFILALNREDIRKVVEQQQKRETSERHEFLREIPEFKSINKNAQLRICGSLEPVECIKGSVIFNMGDDFKYIYFIKKGEFQQNVRVTIKGRHSKEDVDPSELLGKQGETKKKSIVSSKSKDTKNHKMSILGYKKVVGLEEYFTKQDTYATTLICLGDREGGTMKGELYRIDKETFSKKVESQIAFARKGKEKIAESTANNIKSIRTMHKTHQHMNDSISKALVDDVKGEGSNPFQNNQKRDKKIEIFYGDKETNGVADKEPKSPTLSDRLPASPSPERAQADFGGTTNLNQMRKSMAQPGVLHGDITTEIGN